MKKRLFMGIVILVITLLFMHMPSSFFVEAQVIERNNDGIPDFYLYTELLLIANQGRETPLLKLETDSLLDKEAINITNNQIQSLEGLHLLNLSNLKTLNLSKNAITMVSTQNLSTATNLEVLNLNFNQLTQIDVSQLSKLNTLLLEFNKLTQIDVGNITSHMTYGNGYVNLKNNRVQNLSQINLPNEQGDSITVDLNNNYLVNQNPALYTETHEVELLVQGAKNNDVLLEGNILQVYETSYYENFNVKIYDKEQNFVTQVQEAECFELTPGEYVFYYYNLDTPLYNETTQEPNEFSPANIIVNLQQPTIQVKINNETIEPKTTYKEPVTLQFSTYNQDATVSYSINNGEWKQGSELMLTKNNQYNIRVRANLNGIYSNTTQITFNISEPWQNTQNAIKAVVSFTVIGLILMGGYFYYKKRTEK